MTWKATATVTAANDDKTTYSSGKALTQAEAENEVKAILATIVGKSIDKVTVTHELEDLTGYALKSAVAQFEDIDLIMERIDAALGLVSKNRFVENMALSYKRAFIPNVDTTNTDIIAIGTAYRDGDGVGGYSVSPESKFRI